MRKIWIGIDTGGTFTDLALCDLTTGRYTYHKLPTTTGDPAKAVLDGIAEVLDLAQMPREEVEFLVLGTTLGTNAVLEGKCARTGLISTRSPMTRRPRAISSTWPGPTASSSASAGARAAAPRDRGGGRSLGDAAQLPQGRDAFLMTIQ